jgi:glycosyltransferase involved in cell wall biosynthesis
MKIAYLTIDDPANVNAWSGINAHMADALRQQDAVELVHVGPLRTFRTLISKFKACLLTVLSRKRYLWPRDPALLRAYARRAQRLLPPDCDLIFSPGTEPISYLRTDKPIVFWTDAPFAAMLNYYPWYCGLSDAGTRDGLQADTLALRKSRLAIYSSDWAAHSAINQHGGDPAKILVRPLGANLESTLTDSELEMIIHERQAAPWQFLLVGVDWFRKGADIALEVIGELNRRGFPSELVVAGCRPPHLIDVPARYLRLEGYVDQRTREGRERLAQLFRSALFYLMPSRAEAFGIVYCEANAFGLPCLGTNTGGVCSIIEDELNGRCFAPDQPISDYADFILATVRLGVYPAMCRTALRVSHEKLNWQASVNSLMPILHSIISSASYPSSTSNAGAEHRLMHNHATTPTRYCYDKHN